MRIALLTRRFNPAGGGTERDLIAAAQCLLGAGYDLRIYAAHTAVAHWRGLAIRRMPPAVLGSATLEVLGFGLLAARAARRDGADLVISFGRTIDTDIIRCEGGVHRSYLKAAVQWQPRVASWARLSYHGAQKWMDARSFRSRALRAVASISRLVADDIARNFGLPASLLEVLYNGVDLERFQAVTGGTLRQSARARWELPPTAAVAFIGNGFGRKGLGFLLEAWPHLKAKAVLLIAGSDRAAASYRDLARRLGISHAVRFLGAAQDAAAVLGAADALALTSLFEAFGNVVLEAMAAGLPVLTSTRCGAAEVLPPELRPFVVEQPADPLEIARRLDDLLAAAGALGPIARRAAEEFTWERYGRQLIALIERVSAQPSRNVCAVRSASGAAATQPVDHPQ
jgi:UDP-glucose:(heptosyl)LPS alpha-1,3-glucosyltransferase